jgi:hypothetical protein
MTDEEKFSLMRERLPKITRWIIDHSVGIIGHNNVKPLEHGTGILLRLEEEPIVLTAAHVVAPYTPQNLQLCATEKPSNIKVAPYEKVALGGGNLEVLDLAFLRLSPLTLEFLRAKTFLSLENIEIFPRGLENDLPIVSGFPEADHEIEGKIVHCYKLFTYFANNLDAIDWFSEQERQQHFTVEYPHETKDAFTQKYLPLSDPPGMSGGGTWRCRFNEAKPWDTTAIRLVGLNVEVIDGQEVDFIRSIQMEPVLEFLGQHFPSAKEFLDAAREKLERSRS